MLGLFVCASFAYIPVIHLVGRNVTSAAVLSPAVVALNSHSLAEVAWRKSKPAHLVGHNNQPNDACRAYPGRRVVLVTANEPYMSVFSNWLTHAAAFLQPTDQLVVAAESETVVEKLRNMSTRGPRAFEVSFQKDLKYRSPLRGKTVYKSPIWASVVTHRPAQILKYVEQGCQVFYSDIDAVWVKPVLAAVDKYDGMDMLVADDRGVKAKGMSTYLCTCLLYFQPTEASKRFLRDWMHGCKGQKSDQSVFNRVIRNRTNINFAVLDQDRFPSGNILKRSGFPGKLRGAHNFYVLHANYLVGISNKIKYLRKWGVWR